MNVKYMKVYNGSYLIFFISGKKVKVKETFKKILITVIFVFSYFTATKIAASVETSCQFKGNC